MPEPEGLTTPFNEARGESAGESVQGGEGREFQLWEAFV